MDAQQLIKQLKRETKAHPAKAALLAVMCGVLVYVCVPLFIPSGSAKSKPVADKSKEVKQENRTTQKTVAAANAAQPTADNTVERDWQDIAEAIESDNYMKPAEKLETARDPFVQPPEPIIAEKKPEPKAKELRPAAPPKIHFTPSETGLALSSTLLGPKSSVAMINGKPYHVYDTKQIDNRRSVVPFAVKLENDERSKDTAETEDNAYFVLVDVQPRSIVLWRLGRRYELELPGITLAGRSSSGMKRDQPNPELPASALTP